MDWTLPLMLVIIAAGYWLAVAVFEPYKDEEYDPEEMSK